MLKAHPDFSPAYFPLAEVLRQSGDLDGALAAIESALRVTESAAAYQELAILEKQGGNVGAAARAFHKAEQLKAIVKPRQAAQCLVATATHLIQEGTIAAAFAKLELAISA